MASFSRKKLSCSDLTFVVQGPVSGEGAEGTTGRALASIRSHYPGARIILSTWLGTHAIGLDFDELVFSGDPGSFMRDKDNRIFHNFNRQKVSTLAGLRAVKTPYAVKVRSDVLMTGSGILSWLNNPARILPRGNQFVVLRERALVVNVTSVNPRKGLPLPLHPCDWIYCGRTDDLIDIWDVPDFPEPEWTWWFLSRAVPRNFPFRSSLARYHPENYVWSQFISKHLKIDFDHSSDTTGENVALTEQTFAANLVILSRRQLRIKWAKRVPLHHLNDMYDYNQWRALAVKYCQGTPSRKLLLEPSLAKIARVSLYLGPSAWRRAAVFLLARVAERVRQK